MGRRHFQFDMIENKFLEQVVLLALGEHPHTQNNSLNDSLI
jgi:hypothetical protein